MAEDEVDFKKISLGTTLGVIILAAVIFAGYRYSQAKGGKVVLPGGVTYLGPSPKPNLTQPPIAPLRFTVSPNIPWKTYTGKVYPFSFSYPDNLPIGIFPNDPTDGVGFTWGNVSPENNIFFNVEFFDKRDPKYLSLPKETYIRDWWSFFSGLKGVQKVELFKNASGLNGYKANYLNWADQVPNINVFLEVPGRNDLMLHLANGLMDPAVFDRIVDSVKYIPLTPTP
jgi:hypothetical protein